MSPVWWFEDNLLYKHQNFNLDLMTLSWFPSNLSVVLRVFLCHNSSSDLFLFGHTLLFASLRVTTRLYFHPINYYFDWEGFSQMKVGNHATLFLWEWALSRDKNNHRARALSTATHFLAFLLPHYLRADLFMFSHTLISICNKAFSEHSSVALRALC